MNATAVSRINLCYQTTKISYRLASRTYPSDHLMTHKHNPILLMDQSPLLDSPAIGEWKAAKAEHPAMKDLGFGAKGLFPPHFLEGSNL